MDFAAFLFSNLFSIFICDPTLTGMSTSAGVNRRLTRSASTNALNSSEVTGELVEIGGGLNSRRRRVFGILTVKTVPENEVVLSDMHSRRKLRRSKSTSVLSASM